MIRLGIDASQHAASCAVWRDGEILSRGTADRAIEHFPSLIQDTMGKAGLAFRDLDEIVVCIGPGSQMGTRTTVVTGNVLALALKISVTGILSTDALAAAADVRTRTAVAVSAGRRRWFTASYDRTDGEIWRLDEIQLVDEAGGGAVTSERFGSDDFPSCAEGILLAAAQQPRLVSQLSVTEVLPYDRGDFTGQ